MDRQTVIEDRVCLTMLLAIFLSLFLLTTDLSKVDQVFAPSIQSTTEMEGISASWVKKNFNTQLSLYRTAQTQESLDGAQDFASQQDMFEWTGSWRMARNQTLDLLVIRSSVLLAAG